MKWLGFVMSLVGLVYVMLNHVLPVIGWTSRNALDPIAPWGGTTAVVIMVVGWVLQRKAPVDSDGTSWR